MSVLRNRIAVLLVCIAALQVSAFPVAAGERGCDDIIGGEFLFTGSTVQVDQYLVAPSNSHPTCESLTYTLYVLDGEGGSIIGTGQPVGGTGAEGDPQQFVVNVVDADGVVCIYGTVNGHRGQVLDRAPDSGCLKLSVLPDDDNSGGSMWS